MKGSIFQELQRENEMSQKGRNRFTMRNDRLSKSNQNNAHNQIELALPKVTEAITEAIIVKSKEQKGRPPHWLEYLKEVDADKVSYIGLNSCMDAVGQNSSLTKTIVTIGRFIELELFAQGLRQNDIKAARRIEEKVTKDHSSMRHRVKAARIIASRNGYVQEPWADEVRAKVGMMVWNCISSSVDLFEIWETSDRSGKTMRRIGFTDTLRDALDTMDAKLSWAEPMFEPMIVKPREWTDIDTGCYWETALSSHISLVRYASKKQLEIIKHDVSTSQGRPVPYIDALNKIQSSAFKINPYVLEAVKWAWDEGKHFGKFPRRNYLDKPKRSNDWSSKTDFEKKAHIIKSRGIVVRNRSVDGNRAVMKSDLNTAEYLSQYDEFYLPHNFDFRGRVYPIPHFNHHRDDHIKAMFLIANGKPLGESGLSFIALQVANSGDFEKVSKKSFDDRLKWVSDNESKVMAVGKSFEDSYDIWSKADCPFQFLAACREYYLACQMDNHEDYVSGLPVGLDGTNSGIQHYAAASRSSADGVLVNLIPGEAPRDIYQAVADRVNELIQDCDEPEAKYWRDYGVGRKTVKRNVMTFGYSSEQYGFANQIMEDLMRPLQNMVINNELDKHPFGEDEGYKASQYLAKQNWIAVNEVIKSASHGMTFFKELASTCAHNEIAMRWTTPIGFPVVQRYNDWDLKKIKLYLHDREAKVYKRSQVSIRSAKAIKINKRKSRSAVSPNIIHSADSCHLLMTVRHAAMKGVKDFFLIHDSFATVPGDTWLIYDAIRYSFVNMYEDWCLYSSILEEVKQQIPLSSVDNLPEIPVKGDLDINVVLNSEYCFS